MGEAKAVNRVIMEKNQLRFEDQMGEIKRVMGKRKSRSQ